MALHLEVTGESLATSMFDVRFADAASIIQSSSYRHNTFTPLPSGAEAIGSPTSLMRTSARDAPPTTSREYRELEPFSERTTSAPSAFREKYTEKTRCKVHAISHALNVDHITKQHHCTHIRQTLRFLLRYIQKTKEISNTSILSYSVTAAALDSSSEGRRWREFWKPGLDSSKNPDRIRFRGLGRNSWLLAIRV